MISGARCGLVRRVYAPRERPRVLAFGIWLASRGALVLASLSMTALGTVAFIAYALATPNRPVTHLPTAATVVMAWSAGVTLAVGSALRAVTRDWQEGIIALARARGIKASAYVRGRVGGLVAVLAMAMGAVALVAGCVATAAASAPLEAARDTAAALLYSLAFAATIGPVAMAALGARSRAGGYLTLLGILVLPEVAAPWTRTLLPRGWHELTSIPAALAAVLGGLGSPSNSGMSMVRAIIGLSAVIAVSLVVVRANVPRVSQDPGGGAT